MTPDDFDPDAFLDAFESAMPANGGLPPDPALTGRQAAFCEAYADNGNAAAAARQAGYAAGSAKVTGSRLLTKANVLERIGALREVRNRARAMDRKLILSRLEETWQAAMAAGRFHTAMQALRMMAELAGLSGGNARQLQETADLDSGDPAGPVLTAMAEVAHARRKQAAADRAARARRARRSELPDDSGDSLPAAPSEEASKSVRTSLILGSRSMWQAKARPADPSIHPAAPGTRDEAVEDQKDDPTSDTPSH